MHLTAASIRNLSIDSASAQVRVESARLVRPGGRRAERAMQFCECLTDICAALFNVSGKELRQPGRTGQGVSRVRQVAMYVAHVSLRLTMNEVGRGFGRDRTTVLHACHLIEDMRDDEEFDLVVSRTERVALAAFRDRLEF